MNINLDNLGFGEFFERYCRENRIDLDSVARVIAEHKGSYRIKNPQGEFSAMVTGKQMYEANGREDFPAVGDWVVADFRNDPAVIQAILPRKSMLQKSVQSRKSLGKIKTQIIATNIDIALVVESVDRDYSLNRFERYFAIAAEGKIQPAIVLNKIDLIAEDELKIIVAEIKNRFNDIDIITTSTTTTSGLDQLGHFIKPGKTYCFLGSSGVGKSSLINALLGKEILKTSEIGQGTGRGKHTTTHREMFFLSSSTEFISSEVERLTTGGGILVDNPGMREVGLGDATDGITSVFNEVSDLASRCRFPDCSHIHEPGCVVLAALESGELDGERYENYIRLNKEAAHYEMTDYEKRDKERNFSKQIKKSLEKLDKYH